MVDRFKKEFFNIIGHDLDETKANYPGLPMTYLAVLNISDIEFKNHSQGDEKKIEIVINTNSSSATSLITNDPKSFQIIKNALLKKFPDVQISYRVTQKEDRDKTQQKTDKVSKSVVPAKSKVMGKHLVKSFTFDNLIVGETNQEAFNICKRLAETPRKGKNVLLFYSRPALGKTHLVSAIANYIDENVSGVKVYFFKKNDFISNLLSKHGDKERRVSAYIDELISADIVIFDDVQMLFDRTIPFALDVFYEMVDARVTTDQPLTTVFTADKRLSDYKIEISKDSLEKEQEVRLHFEYNEENKTLYKTLAGRITTRIESGRTIELGPPTAKMKELWMLRYFESESISIEKENMDHIKFIALKGPTNFRDLRNICEKVKDKVLDQIDLSRALAMAIEGFATTDDNDIKKTYIESTIQDLIELSGISAEQMTKRRLRDHRVGFVRDTIFYVLQNHLNISQSNIAGVFGLSKGLVSIRLKEYEEMVKTPEEKSFLEKALQNLRPTSQRGK